MLSACAVPRNERMKYFSKYGCVMKLSGEKSKRKHGILSYQTVEQAKRAYADGIRTSKGICYKIGKHEVYLKPCWLTQHVSIYLSVGWG